jgi:hypothetical protein
MVVSSAAFWGAIQIPHLEVAERASGDDEVSAVRTQGCERHRPSAAAVSDQLVLLPQLEVSRPTANASPRG